MRSIAVDAGPLVALGHTKARDHQRVLSFVRRNTIPLVTNWIVLGEAAHILGAHRVQQRKLLTWAHKALVIDEETTQDTQRIIDIMEKYADLPADLADASLLALCERRGIDHIATLDSDFEVYRTKSRKALTNVLAQARGGPTP